MQEYEELFTSYSKLGLEEKRKAFNEELVKISYILNDYLNRYNQNIKDEPYIYDKNRDQKLSESQNLDLNYKTLYYIKTKLLILMTLIDSIGDNHGN